MDCSSKTRQRFHCLAIALLLLAGYTSHAVAQVDLGHVRVGATGNGLATITATTAGVLGTISVRFMGAEGLDFANAGGGSCATGTTYAANASCTVNVGFTPRLPGQRRGAVVLLDTSGNVIGTEYVQGTGVGPQASVLAGSGVATAVQVPQNNFANIGLAVDATETVYTTGSTSSISTYVPSGNTYVLSSNTVQFSGYGGLAVDGAGFIDATELNIAPALFIPARQVGQVAQSGRSLPCATLPNQPYPASFATDGQGNGYVQFNRSGSTGFSFATGTCAYFNAPFGITCPQDVPCIVPSSLALDPFGNFFVDSAPDYSGEGTITSSSIYKQSNQQGSYVSTQIFSQVNVPQSPVSDGTGNIFIADGSIYLATLRSDGTYSLLANNMGNHQGPLALDGNGNLFTDGGSYEFNLLNPSPVSFGSAGAGQSGTNLSIPVANTGNEVLTIGSITFPTNFPEATGITGECSAGQTIAVGGSCVITAVFNPMAALNGASSQTLSQSIKLVSNSLNGSATEQDIPVTGTETLPLPTIALTSSKNPAASGSSVTFSANVTGVSGGQTPTGTVNFLFNNNAEGLSGTLATATLVSGIATSTPAALPDGTYSITAQYSGDANYLPQTSAVLNQTFGVSTPIITWATPAPILYGTPLSVTQLDATASVPGTFTYSPALGTVLSLGTQTLSVTFTPTDTAFYRSATATVMLEVNYLGYEGLSFVPVTPCRVADTRGASGPFGAPQLTAGASREFDIPNSNCGIPSSASAYSLNVTVVPDKTLDYLTLWPSGTPQPFTSTLNSYDGRFKANAAIVPAGANGGVDVFVTDASNVILDIDGYFVPAGTPSALAFYPLSPCRLSDTRGAAGSLGGPFLSGQTSRSFPVQSGACGIPANAQAYSLNVTAIPHKTLNYLTAWPAGQAQPYVSTLNAPTGTVTANAAIVPAGASGAVSLFVSDDADVILDINGYFAPPASGGLSFYPAQPCRVIDTRTNSGLAIGGERVQVLYAGCSQAGTAQAYLLNATVVPLGPLNYLTLWPDGTQEPYVSALNADDGAVTSNMAIVSTDNGNIDVFNSNPTQLILDLNGYFAP